MASPVKFNYLIEMETETKEKYRSETYWWILEIGSPRPAERGGP